MLPLATPRGAVWDLEVHCVVIVLFAYTLDAWQRDPVWISGRPNRLRPPLLREPRIQMLPSDMLGVGADAHTVHKERNWVDRVTDLRGGRRMSQECCWTWRQRSRSTAAELDGYCVEGQYGEMQAGSG